MSHFSVLVLVPENTKDIEKYIEKVMAPYSEAKKVPEYEADCYCRGKKAREEVRNLCAEKFGTIDQVRAVFQEENAALQKKVNSLRSAYYTGNRDKAERKLVQKQYEDAEQELEKLWKAVIRPISAFEKETFKKHRGRNKPDPTCGFYSAEFVEKLKKEDPKKYQGLKAGDRYDDESGCGGTGKYLTKYNQKSKWDWYEIGGRWTGALVPSYDPEADPDNWETCWVCHGTGLRMDTLGIDHRKKDPEYTCNGCQGNGKSVKFHLKKFDGDIVPTNQVPNDFSPFAIVTPDGEWHEHGKMGWFATVSDEDEGWDQKAKSIINDFRKTTISVIVDCHI
jgi:hypothetical protein